MVGKKYLKMPEALARVMELRRVSRNEAIEILCAAALSGELCPTIKGRQIHMPADVEKLRNEMRGDA